MSEEPQAPVTPVAPPAGPEGTPSEPQTDWQKRFEDTQAAYTQGQQKLSEFERDLGEYQKLVGALQSEDPDTRLRAAQILGLELAPTPDEPDEDLSFADEQARKELAEIRAWKEQLTQGAQKQAEEQHDIDHIGVGLADLQGKLGRDLTDHEQQLLGDSAWANRDEQGLPNISAVTEAYLQVINGTVLPGYKNTKPRAAAVAAGGVAGQQVPDRANETQAERWERMAQELADRSAET